MSHATRLNLASTTLHRRSLLATVLGAFVAPRLAFAQTPQNPVRAGSWVEATGAGLSWSKAAVGAVLPPIRFATPWPIFAAAAHWSNKEPIGARLEVEFSVDGAGWSAPVTIGEDADHGRPGKQNRRYSPLVMTDGARFVRYRGYNAAGEQTALRGLTWAYLDPSGGPASAAAENPSGKLASAARPFIVSRESWGADETLRFMNEWEIWPPERAPVSHLIVHHTTTMNAVDSLLAVRALYHYHAVTKGWGDLGYNYLIDAAGNIYEGRAGGPDVVGAHTTGYNAGACGIGMIGAESGETLPSAMHNGLTRLAAWLTRDLDLGAESPLGDIAVLPTLCAHRDVNHTGCPGDLLSSDLAALRETVEELAYGPVPDSGPDTVGPGFAQGDRVTPLESGVALRDGPGLSAAQLTLLDPAQSLTIGSGPTLKDGIAWYELDGGAFQGWAAGSYLRQTAVSDSPAATGVGSMSADSAIVGEAGAAWPEGATVAAIETGLNVRATPGGDLVLTVPRGSWLSVTGAPAFFDNTLWYPVDTGLDATGWVAGEFIGAP